MTEPVSQDKAPSTLANNESTVQVTQRAAKPVAAPEPAHESLSSAPAVTTAPVPAHAPAPVAETAPVPAVPAPAEPAPAPQAAPVMAAPAPVVETVAAPVFSAPEVQETPQLSIPERMNLLQSTQQTVNNQLDALEAALKKKTF